MTKWKLSLGVAIALAACNSTNQVASHYAKSQLVTRAAGGTVSVTSSDDATLAGTAVQIPANALAQDTTVTIAEGIAVTSGQFQAAGPVADFGPSGTTFLQPVTVTLPFALPSGANAKTLEVVAIEDNGTQSVVANASLTIGSGTVSFSTTSFMRFGCVVPPPQTCPAGEFFCGCPGYGGSCIPDIEEISCVLNCPIEGVDGGICAQGQGECCGVCQTGLCPAIACFVDAGSPCGPGESFCDCTQQCAPANAPCPLCAPLDGGASVCPPGEVPCCPGDPTTCQPIGSGACTIACTVPFDGGTSACPPGDYFCGCPGYGGTCIPNNQVCDLNCPIEPSDAGVVCPASENYCCGVCQTGPCTELCVNPVDGGPGGGVADAGSSVGPICPQGEFFCGCPGMPGTCEPLGTVCALSCPVQSADAG